MATKKIFCHNCGTQNLSNQKFCSECGTKLNKSDNNKTPGNNAKTISGKKLLYYIIGVIVLAVTILVSTGTFDKPNFRSNDFRQQSGNQNFQSSQSTPDLNNIKKISQLEKVVEKNPNNYKALLQLANLLNDSRFYERAIKEYTKYLQKNKKNVDVWVDMGVCYYQLRNHSKAIETMEKAIAINPKHQIANFNLGIVNNDAGNKKIALSWWKKAVAINPNSNIGKKAQELINQNNR